MPHFFVYGALMRHEAVKACGRRARLEHFAARFVVPGLPILEPRFLGLVEEPGATTHGVAVELSPDAWTRLTRHEEDYEPRIVTVHTDDGTVEATALVLPPSLQVPEGLPSGRYADLLVDGARHFELPNLAAYRDIARRASPWSRALKGPMMLVKLGIPYLGARGAAAVVTTAVLALAATLGWALWGGS